MTLNIKRKRNFIILVGLISAVLGFWIIPLFNLADYSLLETLRTYVRLVGVLGSFVGLTLIFLPDYILVEKGRISWEND